MSATLEVACSGRQVTARESSDIPLREFYRRRKAQSEQQAQRQCQAEGAPALQAMELAAEKPGLAHLGTQRSPPKHSYSAIFQAGQASPSKLLLQQHAGLGNSPPSAEDSPVIAAFRPPGSPERQPVHLKTMPLSKSSVRPGGRPEPRERLGAQPQTAQQGRADPTTAAARPGPNLGRNLYYSRSAAGQASRPSTAAAAAVVPCASPEPPHSEVSTVDRAINAAIASSVELLMCSSPPGPLQLGSPAASVAGISGNAKAVPVLESPCNLEQTRSEEEGGAAWGGTRVSISPFGFLDLNSGHPAQQPEPRQGAGKAWGRAGMPAPPPAPTPPPQPCISESSATQMRAVLSPTFMTSKSRPIFCELDDPGSGICFPANRRRTRFQRFLGRLKSCFVSGADYSTAHEPHTPLETPRLRQSSSPQLPRLAIPSAVEPLRRSMAPLPGDGMVLGALQAMAAEPAPPHPASVSEGGSPPHADLLGLFDDPSDIAINIASPPAQSVQAEGSCLGDGGGGSLCATPAEQLVATNLLTARNGTPDGAAEDVSPGQMHAKRCLMELLRSRADGFGTQQALPGQQGQGPQQPQQGQGPQPAVAAMPMAAIAAEQVAYLGSGGPAAALPEVPAPVAQQQQRSRPAGEDVQQQQGRREQSTSPAQEEQPSRGRVPGGAALEAQLQELPRPAGAAAAPHPKRATPHSSGPPVRRTAISVSQLLHAKLQTPPSSGKKRRLEEQDAPERGGKLRQSLDSRALQAQRSLEAAKEAASRLRHTEANSHKPLLAAADGSKVPEATAPGAAQRDLSKPCYRSAALHAMLSPAKATWPQHWSSKGGPAPARQPSRVQGVLSAPTSPGIGEEGYAAMNAKKAAGATSAPASPTHASGAQKPPIRMNKAAAARAAAVQQKIHHQQQQGQPMCSMARAAAACALAPGGATTSQLASVAAALHRKAHELASPEKTARPSYARHSSTPFAHRIPAFSAEAGVEPYSVRPAECGGPLTADTATAPVPAAAALGDASSPLTASKYQADRAAYLQMLQQLALGMDVSASVLQPHKQPTPPPVPPGVLEEVEGQQARREQEQQEDGEACRGTSGEERRPKAAPIGPAPATTVVPGLGRCPVGGGEFVVQRNALSDQDDRASGMTARTLVYSLSSSRSHSNELFGQDTATPREEAPAAAVVADQAELRCQQKLVSIHAAAQLAHSTEGSLGEVAGAKSTGALCPQLPAAYPDDSSLTDQFGRGAVVCGAVGQQTVSKPTRARLC